MKHMKLFLRTITYSFKLVYSSSKFMFIPYFLLSIISVTIPLVNTYILKIVLDELTVITLDMKLILFYIILYITLLVLYQGIGSVLAVLLKSIEEKACHQYDCYVSKKLAVLPMSFLDTSQGKNLVNEVKYAKTTASYMMSRYIYILSMFYSFIIIFPTLFKFHLWLSLLFLVLTIPGIIMNVAFEKKNDILRRTKAPDLRRFSYYRWMLTDAWPAKDVRMYDLTESIKERYDTEKDEFREAQKNLDKKKLTASLFAEIIKRSGELIFTVFVIIQALDNKISIGDVTLYIGFALSATNSFQSLVTVSVFAYKITSDRMGYFFRFMDLDTPDENKGSRELSTFESLSFDNVYFKYPTSDRYVLEGVSFILKKGDRLSIVGINGSGKTTIIKLMLGLYPIDSGQILINGYPYSDYDIKDIRKVFSVLFQNFVQYPLTLRNNIALSDINKQNNDDEIMEALSKSGIDDNYDMFKNGLDTYMTRQFDDNGRELSKGQWQKIALSRTYFKNSPIIIFDEPSAALDAEAEDKIFQNFEAMSENKTAIMISHRISSGKLSNNIIVLDGGKIVENGTHEKLITQNGLYAKLYNLQMQKYTIKEAK